MALFFKKALVGTQSQDKVSLSPNKVPSVYDCCTLYWLPLEEGMWTGEVQFRFIKNWADDVELNMEDFDEGIDDTNNNRIIEKSTAKHSNVTKSPSGRKVENWNNDLYPESYMESKQSWEGQFFTEAYMYSFGGSWEGELFSDSFIKSFQLL